MKNIMMMKKKNKVNKLHFIKLW